MLVLIFKEFLGVKIVEQIGGREYVDEDDVFVRLDHNGFNGFYDWLRKNTGEVIGLSFYPFDPEIGRILSGFPYVDSYLGAGGDYISTVYFGDETDEVDDMTIAQHFGDNHLYRSQNGTMAVTFALPSPQY